MQLTAFCFLLKLVALLNFITLVWLVLLRRSKRPGTSYLCCDFVLLTFILNGILSFSYILGRMGKLEDIDVGIFCAAAMNFYRTQVRQVVAASWVSYKPGFPFGLYGVFQKFVPFFLNKEKNISFWTVRSSKPCKWVTHVYSFSISMENFISLEIPLCFSWQTPSLIQPNQAL